MRCLANRDEVFTTLLIICTNFEPSIQCRLCRSVKHSESSYVLNGSFVRVHLTSPLNIQCARINLTYLRWEINNPICLFILKFRSTVDALSNSDVGGSHEVGLNLAASCATLYIFLIELQRTWSTNCNPKLLTLTCRRHSYFRRGIAKLALV